MNSNNPFRPLCKRRECLLPAWRGWLLLCLTAAGLMTIAALKIQPFLANSAIVPAEILVVEGWTRDYVLSSAVEEFNRGHYRKLYVTGTEVEQGALLTPHKSYAEAATATLLKMGMSRDQIATLSVASVQKDRTYASALVLKSRLQQDEGHATAVNLISEGAHSRRSQLLFQKALGENIQVGIIAIKNRDYDPEHWWKYSAGVRTVIGEFIAYLYALLIFPFTES